MRIVLDTDDRSLICREGGVEKRLPLYSNEAFELLSHFWLKVGWNQRYTFTFSWMGRPVIQLPEDLIRYQEAIFALKPDLVIETGIAKGGSLVFSASICKLLGKGRVIGIDIDIRPHNREALEAHPLASLITLIEGNSIDKDVLDRVKGEIGGNDTVLVLLDSCHSKAHMLAELKAYSPYVSVGSYIIATDGFMADLHDVPRGRSEWKIDNAQAAVEEFLQENVEFELEIPTRPYNESTLEKGVTQWPKAWLRRKR
ncbi:MAG: cephalosporin hydroxylase family protein [Chlamydiales bacterium]